MITFDWIDDVIVFQVLPPKSGKQIHGMIEHPMKVSVQRDNSSVMVANRLC
jgi:lipopolysaccharide transport system ATP-binding protein